MRTSDAKPSTEYARHAKLRERAGGGVAAYIVASAYIVVGDKSGGNICRHMGRHPENKIFNL